MVGDYTKTFFEVLDIVNWSILMKSTHLKTSTDSSRSLPVLELSPSYDQALNMVLFPAGL